MSTLEDLQPNAAVRGILPDGLITVVSVQWFGSEALELTYKNPTGRVANERLSGNKTFIREGLRSYVWQG